MVFCDHGYDDDDGDHQFGLNPQALVGEWSFSGGKLELFEEQSDHFLEVSPNIVGMG